MPEHIQQPFGVACDFLGRSLHEHLVPRLLVLVALENHRLAVRLGEEVCVDVQRQSRRLLGGQERVEQTLGERLGVGSETDAHLGPSIE